MDIRQYEVENKLMDALNHSVDILEKVEHIVSDLNINNFSTSFKEKFNKLKSLNFNNIVESIHIEIENINYLLDENASPWETYNEQYKNYYIARLNQIKIIVERFNNYSINANTNESTYANLLDLTNSLSNAVVRNSAFELYEHFKYGNRNYILFGKNGAGKTTLLNKISSEFLNSNTTVLPATRDIKYDANPYYRQNDIKLKGALNACENGKSLFLLGKLLSDEDYNQLRNGTSSNDTIAKKVTSIFNQLGLDRKLIINQHGSLLLGENNISDYLISDASDGERSSIYIVLSVLLSPLNSFVFIDEPENHLNGALMRKLFDLLEKERPDIKFVFATHNIQFIQSRQNVELIYLEKTDQNNVWNFNKFENYENMPLEIILNIEGTNDNIIFCEGENRSSLDYRLYEILFPDFEIVPVHGCENVERQTVLLNDNKQTFKKEAIGIVDNDFKNEEDIKKLKLKKITTLGVNEIENIFILPCCLESMSSIISNGKSINEIKTEIISKIRNKNNGIKQDFATKLLRKIQFQNKFKKIDDIYSDLDIIIESNKINFVQEYQSFENNLLECIKTNNYEELLKIVPAKMILSDVAKIIGFVDDSMYVDNLLMKIKTDEVLKTEIIKVIEI